MGGGCVLVEKNVMNESAITVVKEGVVVRVGRERECAVMERVWQMISEELM